MTTISIPTCGEPEFTDLGPYDSDLLQAFNTELASLEAKKETNTCQCQSGVQDLGYTQALRTCTQCFEPYPILQHAWGCDSCVSVVAPVAFYSASTPENLQKYLTDPVYKLSVDSKWAGATQLERGDTIKKTCISSPVFSLNIPAAPLPSPTPAPPLPSPLPPDQSNPMTPGAIAGIAIGVAALLLLLFTLVAIYQSSKKRLRFNAEGAKYYSKKYD